MKYLLIVAFFAALGPIRAQTLEEGFKAPPDSAKPHTWYHMMNGNVTKEGITCDFEALAKAGIDGGMFGRCLRVAADAKGACGVSLDGSEKLEFENGSDFTVTLWLRLDRPQSPQAPIFANKDWESGSNPGVVLIGARKTDAVKSFGVCFNCGLSGDAKRIDMGTFNIDYGEWCFYAVTRRAAATAWASVRKPILPIPHQSVASCQQSIVLRETGLYFLGNKT